jgi:hypothetical protein
MSDECAAAFISSTVWSISFDKPPGSRARKIRASAERNALRQIYAKLSDAPTLVGGLTGKLGPPDRNRTCI